MSPLISKPNLTKSSRLAVCVITFAMRSVVPQLLALLCVCAPALGLVSLGPVTPHGMQPKGSQVICMSGLKQRSTCPCTCCTRRSPLGCHMQGFVSEKRAGSMKVMPGMVLGDLPQAISGFQAFELQSIVPSVGLATFFLSGFAVRSELKELGNKFDAKMDRQEKELSSMGVKLGVLDVKMGALDDKVGALDVKVGTQGTELVEMSAKLDVLDFKVGALEDKMDSQGTELVEMSAKLGVLDFKVGALEDKMDSQGTELVEMSAKLGVLNVKVGALDDKVGALDFKVGALEDKMDRQGENSFHHLQELSNGMASLGRGMGRLEGIAWRKHEVKSKSENEVMDFDD
jgi:hypothetical protein